MFDNDNAYNALCMWEAMLEYEDELHPTVRRAWEELGTAEMRCACVEASGMMETLWQSFTLEDFRTYEYIEVFDWEFVPLVMRLATFSHGQIVLPKKEAVIAHLNTLKEA